MQPYRRLYAAVPLLGCSQSGGTGRSDADRRVAAGLSPAAFSEGWISAMLDARREPPKPDDDLQPPAPTNSRPRIVLDASLLSAPLLSYVECYDLSLLSDGKMESHEVEINRLQMEGARSSVHNCMYALAAISLIPLGVTQEFTEFMD